MMVGEQLFCSVDARSLTNTWIFFFFLSPTVIAFALCCKSFPWAFPWKCNGPKQDLVDCVAEKGSPAMFLKLRDEYIDKKIEKKRKEEAEASGNAGK